MTPRSLLLWPIPGLPPPMSEIWIALIICIVIVLSGALPLLRDRRQQRTPLPPRPETLRDWRKEETLESWRDKE